VKKNQALLVIFVIVLLYTIYYHVSNYMQTQAPPVTASTEVKELPKHVKDRLTNIKTHKPYPIPE